MHVHGCLRGGIDLKASNSGQQRLSFAGRVAVGASQHIRDKGGAGSSANGDASETARPECALWLFGAELHQANILPRVLLQKTGDLLVVQVRLRGLTD